MTLVEDPSDLGAALLGRAQAAAIAPTAASSLAADLRQLPRAAIVASAPARHDDHRPRPPTRSEPASCSGVAWKAGSQITLQISRMVVALVLARLLAPDDWGLAAMVLVFSGFVVVFTDNALGTALIQRRELLEEDRSTVFWISAAIGLAARRRRHRARRSAGRLLRRARGPPRSSSRSRSASSSARSERHRWRSSCATCSSDGSSSARSPRRSSAPAPASRSRVAGYGAWAIVGQLLAEAVISTVLLWLRDAVATVVRRSRLASLRRLGGFAGNVFGENLLYQAGRNLGSLLIGRVPRRRGARRYALATNVILVPFSRIAAPLQQVFFPPSRACSDDRERMADSGSARPASSARSRSRRSSGSSIVADGLRRRSCSGRSGARRRP